ncbi:MAG: ABC transporter ATP-binding protein [Tenuifilaceae bacterium]
MSISSILDIIDFEIGFDLSAKSEQFYPKINLSASKGELIALAGRNGVGKSTLLRSIARLQPSITGDVLLLGNSFNDIERSQFSQLLSFIPAEPIHAANMTVHEFVAIARYPYHGWFGNISHTDKAIIHSALESVNLVGFSNRELDSLSDGERQRAMIAFAIAQDSQIVLMDEPTAFIDLPNKFEIVRLLKELAAKGKTVIFSTHDLHTALQEVDTMWLMLPNGIETGSPEDLALNKSLDKLLEGTDIYLDLSSGSFVYKKVGLLEISLESDNDIYYQWTKHALERIGFTLVSDETKDVPFVKCVYKDIDKEWKWMYNQLEIELIFNDISSLCTYLKKNSKNNFNH